ncbi:hypothetical protein [Flavisphingomonas formosensis]|uniref:hypothetical protein n=1 Tax=Flavisphingomonas formosensis TaxID=861534 RepID=UPI0012FB32E9|nr:hypothetical protein [Sphingomonas formosensis]
MPLVLGLLALPIGAFGSMIVHYKGTGPSTSAVVGCYIAQAAPAMALDGQRIRFGQESLAPIAYDFSMARLGGLAIAPRRAVRLMHEQAGYRFRLASSSPPGLFPLQRYGNGQWHSVRQPAEMEAIAVPASDGQMIRFERAPPRDCP